MPPERTASQPRFQPSVDWDVRIPARDGIELSANIWRPAGDAAGPVPAILEMIPYGKDNWRRNADTARGEWFAARGYALCRVDVRGTGSSGGVALDEYTEDETRDGFDAVEWLAAQPWCTGAVGMWGISLRRRSRRSRSRSCARRTCARSCRSRRTDDRYLTDVHYIGGCVTASELSQYAVSQVAMNAMPPDAVVPRRRLAGRVARAARGDAAVADRVAAPADRRPVLAARLAGARLRRHRRGDPEHRRLVRRLRRRGVPDAGALHRADADAGRQLGPRLAAGLAARAEPRRAPRDRCGSSTAGCADERERPRRRAGGRLVRARLRGAGGVPGGVAGTVAGGDAYPASGDHGPAVPVRGWRRRRSRAASWSEGRSRAASTPTGIGRRSGTRGSLSWGAGGIPNGLARDLRPDEALGPTYTSAPLDRAALHPRRAGRDPPPRGRRAGRDRRRPPGGRGAGRDLVLGERRDPEPHPSPVRRGAGAAGARARSMEVRVPLRHAGYRFEPGHRIRVSVASSAWPVIWPSPFPATFALHRGDATPSRVELPVIPGGRRSERPARAVVQDHAAGPARGRRGRRRPTSRSGGSRRTSSAARPRSRSTTAARTSSRTAGGCTPPRRFG